MYLTIIKTITNDLADYVSDGYGLLLGIGALIALIGSIRVYRKWQNGDEDTHFAAMAWFSASLFMVMVKPIIEAVL